MKVIIATGGSGGHLFPAIQVAEEFKRAGDEVLFVGAFGSNIERLKMLNYRVEEVKSRGIIGKNLFKMIGAMVAMLKAVVRSLKLIRSYKPDVVLGFGGYGAFPVVFSASLIRLPTLIHEQNVSPGWANRILSRMVSKVAISFKKSADYFSRNKSVYTGCPTPISQT